MISSLLVVFSLAVTAQSWPQLLVDLDHAGSTLPVSYPVTRSLPVDDEAAATLHIPQARSDVDDLDAPFHILPIDLGRRRLPVDDATGVLTLPVIHAARGLVGRSVELQLENRSDVAYYAQLDIGTPPQTVYAQLDTGSFELWVNPDCTTLASRDQTFCEAVGQYDPSESSTSDASDSGKTLRYGIGSADITYVRDDISLSESAKVEQVRFGVASTSEGQFAGILGIGYGEGVNTEYKNFLDELAEQGVTKTKSFSLALGSKDEEEGVIVFGGVDTAKFGGELVPLPIIPASEAPDGVARYWVSMESMSNSPPGEKTKTYDAALPVFLDSGATLTLLPPDLVEAIAADFESSGMDSDGFYAVDCDFLSKDGTVNFAFDGVTISVSYREVVREIKTSPPTCYLGIAPSKDFALLGDTFLRSAYVVFDLESDVAYLAPYTNCGSSVTTIKDSSDLEGLSGDCETEAAPSVTSKAGPTTTSRVASETTSTTALEPVTKATTTSEEASQVVSSTSEPAEATSASRATTMSKVTPSPSAVEDIAEPSTTSKPDSEEGKPEDVDEGVARTLRMDLRGLVVGLGLAVLGVM